MSGYATTVTVGVPSSGVRKTVQRAMVDAFMAERFPMISQFKVDNSSDSDELVVTFVIEGTNPVRTQQDADRFFEHIVQQAGRRLQAQSMASEIDETGRGMHPVAYA